MNDENIVQVAPTLACPDSTNDHSEHALFGKISRFPHEIREGLNQRIHNGKSGSEILAWLNDLAPVKEILAAQFDSKPVSGTNLTHWRQTGYRRWLRQLQRVSALKDLRQYAVNINEADGGQFAPATVSSASEKILEILDEAEPGKIAPDHIVKYAAVSSALAKTQQNNDRIQIARERLRQREMLILLKRDKNQRDTTAVAMRVLKDARAKQIEASSANHAEKIEILGYHLFGDLWEPRVPAPDEYSVTPPPNQ